MVFLIQNTQNGDTKALHLKLDKPIRVTEEERDLLMNLEDRSEDQLDATKAELKTEGAGTNLLYTNHLLCKSVFPVLLNTV